MSNRKLTAQMLFDSVAEHLLAQGKKSLRQSRGYEACAYRGHGGLKCAVGAVILDHEYFPGMEGVPVSELVVCGLLPDRLVPHERLLRALQNTHDTFEPEDWRYEVCRVAVRYGLSTAALVAG